MTRISVSIRRRIYLSFSLLVSLFVLNCFITFFTLNNNKRLSGDISTVIDPALQSLEDFADMVVDSKMYSTNWVFLRSNQADKDALKSLHDIDYPKVKRTMNLLSVRLNNRPIS